MGLIYSSDLVQWRRWQHGHQSLNRPRRVLQLRTRPPDIRLLTFGVPKVLVALDASSTSKRAALLDPLAFLNTDDVALLVEGAYCPLERRPSAAMRLTDAGDIARLAPTIRSVIAAGHYLPVGELAHHAAQQLDALFLVVQHGLLTPFAPPLPSGARLLAWSEEDATFWRSGRLDVSTEVVGSQLIWNAARRGPVTVDPGESVSYLGQLHGAELPRRSMARAARRFCLEHGATYRPHPAEHDVLSRMQHASWERAGIRVDRREVDLRDLMTPVVSVFSTGVLEAAALGLPAGVHYPNPPVWLEELWARYDLQPWGSKATVAPPQPSVEPARRVAEIALDHARGHS